VALTSTSLSPLGMGAARGPARSDAGYTLDDLGWRDDQSEPQKLLKLLGAEAAQLPVSAEDRIRPQLRSQIALTCREHTPTDLESVWGLRSLMTDWRVT